MNIEKALVTKALKGELNTILKNGIIPSMFQDSRYENIFNYIVTFYKDKQQVPSVIQIKHLFKQFELAPVDTTSIDFIIDEFQKNVKRVHVMEMLEEANQAISGGDPVQAVQLLNKNITGFSTQFNISKDIDLSTSVPSVLKACKEALSKKGVIGLPFPWDELNQATGGANKEDYILLCGRPKTGKTHLLILFGCKFVEAGERVLFLSKEMSQSIIEKRYIAHRSHVPYKEIKTGKLTTRSRLSLLRLDQKMKNEKGKFILIEDDATDATGILFLDSKIEEFKPSVVLVDGTHLMADDSGAMEERTRLRSVSRDLKRLARRRKIPVIVALHMNRAVSKKSGEGGGDHVYGSDGFLQDCDIGMEIVKNKDLLDEGCRLLKVFASREGEELFLKFEFNLTNYQFSVVDAHGADEHSEDDDTQGF